MKWQIVSVILYFFILRQMDCKSRVEPVEKPVDLEQEDQNIVFGK